MVGTDGEGAMMGTAQKIWVANRIGRPGRSGRLEISRAGLEAHQSDAAAVDGQ
jgi:hypothetical protein